MKRIGGIAIIVKTEGFMVGYLLDPFYKILVKPSDTKPTTHDCCKTAINFWDIKLNEIEFNSVQQLGDGDVLNLSSFYTDNVICKSDCNYFMFECDMVKVGTDADSVVQKYFPKMVELDSIVVMGKLSFEVDE
ncbi:hypothetical protein HDV01_006508 [Terramyces sp. JEL0728]|nr:hypothetical protein HDV01_006508 [Terramyces sp. JEL0728]